MTDYRLHILKENDKDDSRNMFSKLRKYRRV